jgi:hypothetical protein
MVMGYPWSAFATVAAFSKHHYTSPPFIVAHAPRFIRALRLAVQDTALSRR